MVYRKDVSGISLCTWLFGILLVNVPSERLENKSFYSFLQILQAGYYFIALINDLFGTNEVAPVKTPAIRRVKVKSKYIYIYLGFHLYSFVFFNPKGLRLRCVCFSSGIQRRCYFLVSLCNWSRAGFSQSFGRFLPELGTRFIFW